MVKRFGENVTMTDIESFAVNRTLEEMKEIARRKEQSLYKTIKSGQVYCIYFVNIVLWYSYELYPRLIIINIGFIDIKYFI